MTKKGSPRILGVTALVEMRIVDEPRSAYDWRNDG